MLQTTERDGFTLTARIEPDPYMGPPWQEHDGHGPVSDWTRRAKAPGELVLCSDRGSHCYYDYAGACEIALRDGWGAPGASGTPRQRAAMAARADYERLRDWCEDRWHWVGVVVEASRAGVKLGHASLWGIESDAGDYLADVAAGLADEAIADAAEICAH